MHKLLFNIERDRQNHQEFRAFGGFDFPKTNTDFKTKVDESSKKLISIANVLRIEIYETESDLAERIISFLTDLESFRLYLKLCYY